MDIALELKQCEYELEHRENDLIALNSKLEAYIDLMRDVEAKKYLI